MKGWDETPGGVARVVLGEQTPPIVAQFATELAERREAAREFYAAWGLIDSAGRFTHRAEQRAEITARHRAHMTGERWLSLSEAGEREFVRRMRAAAEARAAAERSEAATQAARQLVAERLADITRAPGDG